MKTTTPVSAVVGSILATAVVLAFTGCASPTVVVSRAAPGPAGAAQRIEKVYDLGDRVDRPYEILGVVSAIGRRAGVRSKGRSMMVKEAEVLGADALVGFFYDQEVTVSTGDADGWAVALAVKFLPDGQARPAPSRAVVALPHTVVGEDFGTGSKAERADEITRKHARMLLARKGYYAVLVEERLGAGFPEDLDRMPPEQRVQYGSPEAESVMLVTLGQRHAFNAILAVGASQELAAALYSKNASAVIWKSTAKGDTYTFDDPVSEALFGNSGGGVAHLFVPSAKTVVSVHEALMRAFETLPSLTARSFPQ